MHVGPFSEVGRRGAAGSVTGLVQVEDLAAERQLRLRPSMWFGL